MNINVPDFLDDEGNIRPELLDSDARNVAGEFTSKRISTHQVRKFYDEVKKYEAIIDKDKKSYKKIKPLIIMLKSKAKYAATKQDKMQVFYTFMEQSINHIKTGGNEIEKFKAFCLFFEAVYGFADLKNQ
jgi:CRISPR type III-A-associated protein Csm2